MQYPECADIVRQALAEDIGTGDITTMLTVLPDKTMRAEIIAQEDGVLAGGPVVAEVFRQIDPALKLVFLVPDGEMISPAQVICTIEGSAQSILIGERTALNFMQRLSGIATKTAAFAELVSGTKARIVDTRKTTPGLRALEKYAVRTGGGHNHRFGLYDAVMIKDNHILASGSISAAVERALDQAPHTMSVTVECDTLAQVKEAVEAGADIILLDNMSVDMIEEAIKLIDGEAMTEASGGITLETVAQIAQTGVDIISIGALTHSAPALDISLDMK